MKIIKEESISLLFYFIKLITLIVSVILFNGCVLYNSATVTIPIKEPQWLLNPYIDNDKFAAVGCAQKHFKGVSAQKNLAISRAIDRIATQNSVLVDNVTIREKSTSNSKKGFSSSSSTSLHTVKKIKISTKVKKSYTKKDGELCIWMVQR
jgi:hypothetical protein